jgi:signal peptidase II
MKTRRIARLIIILILLSSNIGCDQVSKHIVRQRVGYYEQIGFLSNHLILTKVENTGAFLSLGNSLPPQVRFWLLSFIPLIVLTGGLVYLILKENLSRLSVVGICFVIGGGIGNLYDRMVYGSVTDFLHIDLGFAHTGIFNMADVSITSGVITILLSSWLRRRRLPTVATPDVT